MTFDQVLEKIVSIKNKEHFDNVPGILDWTEDTREANFKAIIDLIRLTQKEAFPILEAANNKQVADESLLSQMIGLGTRKEFLTYLIEARSNLDLLANEEAATLGFDYDWINSKIKMLITEIQELDRLVNKGLEELIEEITNASVGDL